MIESAASNATAVWCHQEFSGILPSRINRTIVQPGELVDRSAWLFQGDALQRFLEKRSRRHSNLDGRELTITILGKAEGNVTVYGDAIHGIGVVADGPCHAVFKLLPVLGTTLSRSIVTDTERDNNVTDTMRLQAFLVSWTTPSNPANGPYRTCTRWPAVSAGHGP
jgi:hypothetical protein